MKKIFSFFIALLASLSMVVSAATNNVPKTPVMSASIKPAVAMYKQGNYVGALQELKEIVEKEKNNTYAKYYLALSYTQLGHRDDAQRFYQEIVDNKNSNPVLIYYSQRALDCIGNPDSEQCNPSNKAADEEVAEVDDITKFINSGRQFHPSVTDRVTKERMERQIQKEEYEKKQKEYNRTSYDNSMPTNEEIAAALNTLSKIGMNPYTQNQMQSAMMFNPMNLNSTNGYNIYGAMLNNTNPDIAKMFLYSQQNSLMNYGI